MNSGGALVILWLTAWTPLVVLCAVLEHRARRRRPLPPPEDPRKRNAEALSQYRARAEHAAQAETRDAQWHA